MLADGDELARHCEEARKRSRSRRTESARRRRSARRGLWLAGAALIVCAFAIQPRELSGRGTQGPEAKLAELRGASDPKRTTVGRRNPQRLPTAAAVRHAWRFARERGGQVSFAVVDSEGTLRGRAERRRYVSASVVKAMLLAAEVRRLRRASQALDDGTAATLRAMITYSDNAAADSIYSRVGDAGLYAVARRARMEGFTVDGYWANAQITAEDMARLFASLDVQMAGPNRVFALGLLGSVIPEQRWGIPAAVGGRWAVRFKGGWRATELGALVHQVAELRDGDTRLALAILTDGQASQDYAIETVSGIAARLLGSSEPTERPKHDTRGHRAAP